VREGARSALAMEYAQAVTSPGTPIVFLVDDRDTTSTFLAARAANILRAAASPERARDVFVFLGRATDYFAGRATERHDPQYDAISASTLSLIPSEPAPLVIALREFYLGRDVLKEPRLHRLSEGTWASKYVGLTLYGIAEPERLSWGPSNSTGMLLGTIGILLVLAVLGIGYAIRAFEDVVLAIASAPAFGAAALTIAAVALDRLGLRLQNFGVAIAAAVLPGLGGLAVFLVQRQRDRQTAA
jgi:hypothetical protein